MIQERKIVPQWYDDAEKDLSVATHTRPRRLFALGVAALAAGTFQVASSAAVDGLHYANREHGLGLELPFDSHDPVRPAERTAFDSMQHDDLVRCNVSGVRVDAGSSNSSRHGAQKHATQLDFTVTIAKGPEYDTHPALNTEDGREVEISWSGLGKLKYAIETKEGVDYDTPHNAKTGKADYSTIDNEKLDKPVRYGVDVSSKLSFPATVHLFHSQTTYFYETDASAMPWHEMSKECATVVLDKAADGTIKVTDVDVDSGRQTSKDKVVKS